MADHDEQSRAERALERVAAAAVIEQRRARRWRVFFQLVLLVYLGMLLAAWLPSRWDIGAVGVARHTAVVRLEGLIAPGGDADADTVVQGLRAAFADPATAAVVLRINSPGGSPVQAGRVYQAMRALRAEHPGTPLYAVIDDIGASGGYYAAVGAARILADRASLVGSIGVRADGFGFVDTLRQLGVERRLHTAGADKGFLDPFLPERAEDVAHLEEILGDIHRQFIDTVREGRGERLKAEDVFSGRIWTGEQALALGLIDALGEVRDVALEVEAEKVVDFTPRERWLERALGRLEALSPEALRARLARGVHLY